MTSDRETIQARQREQWNNVATGWRSHWATYERDAQPLSDRMLELAHVGIGQRVLDVATGIGEPAMTAARLVGASGSVVAIDQAPQMLQMARERIQAAGLRNLELLEADAESVVLPPDQFDAVVCRWGLMLLQDPLAALRRFRSSLVPGGWLAAAIWGPPERVPMISLPFAAQRSLHQEPPPLPAGPNPFALSAPSRLEQVLRDAGYAEVACESFTVTFSFGSVAELVDHLWAVSAPIGVLMAASSPEHQARFWASLGAAAAGFAGADGAPHLPNECLVVAGRRSA